MTAADNLGDSGNLNTSTRLFLTILDQNDNAPIFLQNSYELSVVENSPYGTLVGELVATDADTEPNNALLYSVIAGGNGMFYVDPASGTSLLHNCIL